MNLRRSLLLTVCFAFAATACEPTPGHLRRWKNTEGSEEKFIGYMHDPELSHEVHVTALELLIEQWDYSASFLANGEAVRGMPDAAERDATLRDAIPRLRELYDQGEVWVYKMRDAAYHLRDGTDDAEIQAQLDAVIADWLTAHYDPCQVGGGTVPTEQLLRVLGPETASPRIVEILSDGAFDRALCFGRNVTSLEWLHESEAVATAYTERWDSGEMSESQQLKFEFLEQMIRLRSTDTMRTWMFAKLSSDDMDPLFKNLILDSLSHEPTDADIEGYTELLGNESYARWAAFQAIVDARGSDGLELVLSNLPAQSEYSFYNGEVRPDGFKSVAENIVCVMPKLTELGDNARVVFERHIADDNVPARLLSIACLSQYGDRQSLSRLSEARNALGRADVAAPGFGEGASVQGVIDATMAAIQARVGG